MECKRGLEVLDPEAPEAGGLDDPAHILLLQMSVHIA